MLIKDSKVVLILLLVLISTLSFSSRSVVDIIYNSLSPHMSEWRAGYMTVTLIEECQSLDLDPLLMVALMKAETGFKNVEGDSGKALGYFQLHENAVEYVKRFYPKELGYVHHKDIPRLLKAQIQIACRYIYLINTYITNGNLRATLDRWNGSKPYGVLSLRTLVFYAELLKEVK